MFVPNYHKDVPDEVKSLILSTLPEVTTVATFMALVSHLKEPVKSTIERPVSSLFDKSFTFESGKPNWKLIGKFKKTHQIARSVRLPLTDGVRLNTEIIYAMRTCVVSSVGYRSMGDGLTLIMQAQENGLGRSPYTVVLYLFDLLLRKFETDQN